MRGRLVQGGMASWRGRAGTAGPAGRPVPLRRLPGGDGGERLGGAETGWQPLHLAVEDDGGDLGGRGPLYVKSHSWGEYVFDHAWADAYRRAAAATTRSSSAPCRSPPVPGRRLLARDEGARETLAAALRETASRMPVSSLHVTFCAEAEALLLARYGFLVRRGVQYHWDNRGYGASRTSRTTCAAPRRRWSGRSASRSAQRPGDRRPRRRGAHGKALDDFYPFYVATVDKRWGSAYLTRDFFRLLGRNLRDRVVLVTARRTATSSPAR
jgi:predicted N-acyltransferase